MNSVKNQVQFEHCPGRIEVTHFDEDSQFMTFSGLHGYRPDPSTLDPHFQDLGPDSQLHTGSQELYLLDSDIDDFTGKLEQYMKQMAHVFYDHEPSGFMKPTLILAAELGLKKQV